MPPLTEETVIPSWLVLPLVALAYFAGTAVGASPPGTGHDAASQPSGQRPEVQAGTNPRDVGRRPRRSRAGFPNPANTGVPPGWQPSQIRTTDLRVTQPGKVVKDVLLRNADLLVEARNVKIRRVKLQGGVIDNWPGSSCDGRGLLIEDTTIEPAPGEPYTSDGEGVIRWGGYTARRVEIWNRGEGFRVADCGPVRILGSFARIQGDTADCPLDLHSDGIQTVHSQGLTVKNSTLIFGNQCGTAPFFVSSRSQATGAYKVDRLLVEGGTYPFRLGLRARVSGLRIVKDSWVYGPIDVKCSVIQRWGAKIVTINPQYRVTDVVRKQPCNTEGGE